MVETGLVVAGEDHHPGLQTLIAERDILGGRFIAAAAERLGIRCL